MEIPRNTQVDDWREAKGTPALGEGEVHVWQVSLSAQTRAADWSILSADERTRAGKFHFEHDRAHYCATRATLRRILAAQMGAEPGGLRLGVSISGKPCLTGDSAGADLRFSVSHSHDVALIALTRGAEVGVDVERQRADMDTIDLATQVFTPEEVAQVRHATANNRDRVFFACWTRKEACAKAIGVGLQLAPESFYVGGENFDFITSLVIRHVGTWHALTLYTLPSISGYESALATADSTPRALKFWRA